MAARIGGTGREGRQDIAYIARSGTRMRLAEGASMNLPRRKLRLAAAGLRELEADGLAGPR
jgi:hypothetical protein